MKVQRLLTAMALFILILGVSETFSQGRGFGKKFKNQGANCTFFVDANNDGICDNFIDNNNDGICDNRYNNAPNRGQSYNGYGQRLRIRTFADNNDDGICDNYQSRIGQNFQPNGARIFKPFPNPFSSTCNFDIYIPSDGNVTVSLTDLNGKVVKEIFKGKLVKGTHNFKVDSENLQTGRYFIVLKFDGQTISKPIIFAP